MILRVYEVRTSLLDARSEIHSSGYLVIIRRAFVKAREALMNDPICMRQAVGMYPGSCIAISN
jgi:hypothetical protein